MTDRLQDLLEQTIRRHVHSDAALLTYTAQPMQEGEQGYSDAPMARHIVTFAASDGDAHSTTLVTKEASLLERRVLDLLGVQGHCVPFSHTLNLLSDGPVSVCQQDLRAGPDDTPPDIERQTARCLARIHCMNLGRERDLSWLPHADRTYIEQVILADYRTQLAQAMRRPEFHADYSDSARQIEQAVHPFLAAMDALWQEGDSLTLIHADMMNSHVIIHDGQPYLIDWGQARYGSFYLDLPNYFTPENVLLYRDALAELGHDIPVDQFMARFRDASRYPGFKYIGFLLFQWANGRLDSLHGPLLQQLIHGTA